MLGTFISDKDRPNWGQGPPPPTPTRNRSLPGAPEEAGSVAGTRAEAEGQTRTPQEPSVAGGLVTWWVSYLLTHTDCSGTEMGVVPQVS